MLLLHADSIVMVHACAAQPLGADYVYISTNDSAYQNAISTGNPDIAEFVCAVCTPQSGKMQA